MFRVPTQESVLSKPNGWDNKGEDLKKIKLNGPGRYNLERETFLAVGEASMDIYSDPPQA